MKVRRTRKIDSGSSNLAGRARGKFIHLDQKDPDWLRYFSLPKDKLMEHMSLERRVNPNPFLSTIELYKSQKRNKPTRDEDLAQPKSEMEDIRSENGYTKGQSNLSIDFQKGATAIERLNMKGMIIMNSEDSLIDRTKNDGVILK